MPTYERTGNPPVPQWWLDKVLPMLEHGDVRHIDVARAASEHARREKPWGRDAISKFIKGEGRTPALTNGISAALRVPPPFFTAPTEAAASKMSLIADRAHEHEDAVKLVKVVDGVADAAMRAIDVELRRNDAVASSDHAGKGGRGVRDRRAGRSRS